jgi:hypothetical protein
MTTATGCAHLQLINIIIIIVIIIIIIIYYNHHHHPRGAFLVPSGRC